MSVLAALHHAGGVAKLPTRSSRATVSWQFAVNQHLVCRTKPPCTYSVFTLNCPASKNIIGMFLCAMACGYDASVADHSFHCVSHGRRADEEPHHGRADVGADSTDSRCVRTAATPRAPARHARACGGGRAAMRRRECEDGYRMSPRVWTAFISDGASEIIQYDIIDDIMVTA